MRRIFSNGLSKDYVIKPFDACLGAASHIHLAAPYFTRAKEVVEAAKAGKKVQLLIGLNASTTPEAVSLVFGLPNLAVRYLTRKFHAKIYIFDTVALVGSSNLTDAGLTSNREAVICLNRSEDSDAVEETRALFAELWDSAHVLTAETLRDFRQAHARLARDRPDPDTLIENAVGRAEPRNVNVASQVESRERIFLQELRRQVYEGYRPAFLEVMRLLNDGGFRRTELEGIGAANETNRFLNWVRLTNVTGDGIWQGAPIRSEPERRSIIVRLGAEWAATNDSKVPEVYVDWLGKVADVFGSPTAIDSGSKERITDGLMSLHAFTAQDRFVKGGLSNLPKTFWSANQDDVLKVKRALKYLLYGRGEFIQRLHDVLYDSSLKPSYFGRFCALELVGTLEPEICPPINGRMAKALRYLGFDVSGT